MINFRVIVLAIVLCFAMPYQSACKVKYDSEINTEKTWWPLLYPQLCGNDSKVDAEKAEITFKILEIH